MSATSVTLIVAGIASAALAAAAAALEAGRRAVRVKANKGKRT